MKTTVASLLIAGFIASPPLTSAHHSFAAEYDSTKPVMVTGVVTKVEWSNPHIWFYVDVKDESGKITNWGFSAAPPGVLQRRGITKDLRMHTDAFHTIERLRRVDANTIAYQMTIDDPKIFTAPWSEDFEMKLHPEWAEAGLFEFVCEENNRCPGGQCRN